MNRTEKMRKMKILPLLIRYSIPSIIGMLVYALYNIIDRIYVGQGVGTTALSGLTVVFPIQLIVYGFTMLVGVGGSALISIFLGKNERKHAEKIVGTGFVLLAFLGIFVTVLGLLFSKQFLLMSGATESNISYAYNYMNIIFYFLVFQFVGYGSNAFIRAEGNPIRSMLVMIAGAACNAVLDPIFIFVFKMGVQGAALATGLSVTISFVWNIYYFIRGNSILKLKLKNMIPDFKIILSILKIGAAPFFIQIINSILNIVMLNQIKIYGGSLLDKAQAAVGVIYGFNMIFFMPLFGLSMGAQPIIGFNYGAKQFDRVKKTLFYTIIAALSITTLCFIIGELFPKYIFMSFNSEDLLFIKLGSKMMRIMLIAFPIMSFYIISSSYFQAVGNSLIAFFFSIVRPLLILIPLYIILPIYFGLNGVWFAIPIADVISSLITLPLLYLELRKLNKRYKENSIIVKESI